MIWLCFMYWHTIYHHSDSYYALEFGVILNFFMGFELLYSSWNNVPLRSRIFFKNSVLLNEPVTVLRTCLKDYLSSTQTNKNLLILCVHFMTTVLAILLAFSWPWGFSCWYTFAIVSWMTFKWIFALKRTSQQSEKSSRRDGWVKYSRNYRISTKWSFGRHNDPTKIANPWNLWLSYLASQRAFADMNKLRILRWGYYSGLSGLTESNPETLQKRDAGESESG